MLNETTGVYKGLVALGCIGNASLRPGDFTKAGSEPCLLVNLNEEAMVTSVGVVSRDKPIFRFSNGNQTNFPLMRSFKEPLLEMPTAEQRAAVQNEKDTAKKRKALLALIDDEPASLLEKAPSAILKKWPEGGIKDLLLERCKEIASTRGTENDVMLRTMDLFLLGAEKPDPFKQVLLDTKRLLIEELRQSIDTDLLELATDLLVGKLTKGQWKHNVKLLLQAEGCNRVIYHPAVVDAVSAAVIDYRKSTNGTSKEICSITGKPGPCISEESKVPVFTTLLGQIKLFSRSRDTKALERYGRAGVDSLRIGVDTVANSISAIERLTSIDMKGRTWRAIPSESEDKKAKPDLLLAFVEAPPTTSDDVPVIQILTDDDYIEEELVDGLDVDSAFASYAVLTQPGIASIQGRGHSGEIAGLAEAAENQNEILVQILILRKVNTGTNGKVVCAYIQSKHSLFVADMLWRGGEKNVPDGITYPIWMDEDDKKPKHMKPFHIAPLSCISFSKKKFYQGTSDYRLLPGITAPTAFEFFLGQTSTHNVVQLLKMVLERRTILLAGAFHERRRFDIIKSVFTKHGKDILQTVTVLGQLLYKLGIRKDVYMDSVAYKLGQFLAGMDSVHAGYCIDVRNGELPPSLLGNQMYTLTSRSPVRALDQLANRFKLYYGWATRKQREDKREDNISIKTSLYHAREMKKLMTECYQTLKGTKVDEVFRAELLMGYVAGIPKSTKSGNGNSGATEVPQE